MEIRKVKCPECGKVIESVEAFYRGSLCRDCYRINNLLKNYSRI